MSFCTQEIKLDYSNKTVRTSSGTQMQKTNKTKQKTKTNKQYKLNKKVHLSQIFEWYSSDFGETQKDMLLWCCKYIQNSETRRGIEEMILQGDHITIEFDKYDWSLNS